MYEWRKDRKRQECLRGTHYESRSSIVHQMILNGVIQFDEQRRIRRICLLIVACLPWTIQKKYLTENSFIAQCKKPDIRYLTLMNKL